jgi:tetratricopeptide (TPR) repeat protein
MRMKCGLAGSMPPPARRRRMELPVAVAEPEAPATLLLGYSGAAARSLSGVAAAGSLVTLVGCAITPAPVFRVQPVLQQSDAALPRPTQTERHPSTPGHVAVANLYEKEGRWEQAAQYWRRAAEVNPRDIELLQAYGAALVRTDRLDDAELVFRRAAQLRPDQAAVFNNLGLTLAMAGKDDEAASALRQALALDKGHERARANLGWVEQRIAQRTPSATVAAVAAAPSTGNAAPVASTAAAAPTG